MLKIKQWIFGGGGVEWQGGGDVVVAEKAADFFDDIFFDRDIQRNCWISEKRRNY